MFAVTYTDCVQIGPESYREKATTKIFYHTNTINQIFDWVRSLGIQNPDFAHMIFSEVTP